MCKAIQDRTSNSIERMMASNQFLFERQNDTTTQNEESNTVPTTDSDNTNTGGRFLNASTILAPIRFMTTSQTLQQQQQQHLTSDSSSDIPISYLIVEIDDESERQQIPMEEDQNSRVLSKTKNSSFGRVLLYGWMQFRMTLQRDTMKYKWFTFLVVVMIYYNYF